MLELLTRKREAIKAASIDDIRTLCDRENRVLQELGDLEKQRLTIVARLTEHFEPDASQPMRLRDIASRIGGEQGERLEVLGAETREHIEAVRKLSGVLRSASETLSNHVAGILQIVQSALCQARVYGREGQLATGAQVRSTVDLRS